MSPRRRRLYGVVPCRAEVTEDASHRNDAHEDTGDVSKPCRPQVANAAPKPLPNRRTQPLCSGKVGCATQAATLRYNSITRRLSALVAYVVCAVRRGCEAVVACGSPWMYEQKRVELRRLHAAEVIAHHSGSMFPPLQVAPSFACSVASLNQSPGHQLSGCHGLRCGILTDYQLGWGRPSTWLARRACAPLRFITLVPMGDRRLDTPSNDARFSECSCYAGRSDDEVLAANASALLPPLLLQRRLHWQCAVTARRLWAARRSDIQTHALPSLLEALGSGYFLIFRQIRDAVLCVVHPPAPQSSIYCAARCLRHQCCVVVAPRRCKKRPA